MKEEQPPIPSVVAMLVCDTVVTEAHTNKKTLVGVFDKWRVPEIPGLIGPFWVYTKLIDGVGKYVFKLRFVFLDEEQTIAEAVTKEVEFLDRLAAAELPFPMPPIPVQKSGMYELQLYANDVYIGRSVTQVEQVGGA